MSLPLLHAGKSAPGLSAALDLRFALDKSLTAYRGPTPSFSRASTGTYFNSSGVLTSAAINAPRFNHTFNGTSWVSRGLLVEEQRTNILLQSGFASGWGTSSGTLAQASDISSLDGTNNAYKFTDAITNTNHGFYQNIPVSSGSTYSTSIYLKYGNHRYVRISFVVNGGVDSVYVDVDLLNGTIVNSGPYGSATQSSQSISNAGNGWYRVSITGTLPGTSVYLAIYHRSSSSNSNPENTFAYTGNGEFTYFFAPQVEAGSFSTSYIPTTSSAVTRSADVCQITGSDFSGLWNGTEGSFATEYDGQRGNAYIFATHNGGGGWQNSINLRRTNSDDLNQIFTSGVGQAGNSITGPANGVSVKNAFAFKLDDYASSFNGLSVVTDNSCTLPTVSRMDIGYSSAEVAPFNGHIARLRYFNKRLPNATLQLLSEPDPTLNLQFALNKSLTPVAGPAPSFSRASTGSYFDSTGTLKYANVNLLTYSEQFDNAAWVKSNSSISANSISSPNGDLSADSLIEDSTASTTHYFYKNSSFTAGSSYTLSVYAKANTDGFIWLKFWDGVLDTGYYFNLTNGTVGSVLLNAPNSYSIASVGNGWYRCSITRTVAGSSGDISIGLAKTNGGRIFSGDGTSGIYIWGAQLELASSPSQYAKTEASTTAGPRFDHVYSGGQWASRGLLIEEQRTNLAQRSEDFGNAYYNKSDSSISANQIAAPDGATTADKLVENTANAIHYFSSSGYMTTNQTYACSIFVKAAERNWVKIYIWNGSTSLGAWFNLSSGTIGTTESGITSSIQNFGNGWYRCSITRAVSSGLIENGFGVILATADNSVTYTGDGSSGVYVWGSQVEAGSFSTSYIGTTSSSVTRSADVCQITGTSFGSMWNQGEGSFAFEADTFSNSTAVARYYYFDDSATGNQIIGAVTLDATGNTGGDYVASYAYTGSYQALLLSQPARPLAKSAFGWKLNDFASSLNGAAVITDLSGSIPTGINRLALGATSGSAQMLNGHIAKLIYYPARLTNAKLQQLST